MNVSDVFAGNGCIITDKNECIHFHIAESLLLKPPRLYRFLLCFWFSTGIHTRPITTNISPKDRQAEATERDASVTLRDWSRKRRPPAETPSPSQ